MLVVHLTARLRDAWRRLEPEQCAWLWTQLRRAFPKALAVTLMPNHVHIVALVPNLDDAHATFVKVLAAFARGVPWLRPVWQPVPEPEVIVGADKILRHVRYALLNPCRAGLVRDPLTWYWSTHRDVIGATHDPWVTFESLRAHLPAHVRHEIDRLHAYVSADPSTQIRGTPLPRAAPDAAIQAHPLSTILKAAMMATRGAAEDHRRRGPTRDAFVWLATVQGWRDAREIARICDVTPSAISRILRGPPASALDHARLCLGDRRLLDAVGAPRLHGVEATSAECA
ncbi:MAG TPA: hypothetical protein VFG69_09105 [Nannocystaceae bacterium]|nr:hypothetical protein [Nannocystaceae bacterium]